jgi:hypothetical protein
MCVYLRSFSERKYGPFGIEHCSVSKDPKKYGKTLVEHKGKKFDCYYKP